MGFKPAPSRLGRGCSALPRALPTKGAWKTMEAWIPLAAKRGKRFGLGDLLIGAISVETDSKLWSLDIDFIEMAKLKWVRLYALGFFSVLGESSSARRFFSRSSRLGKGFSFRNATSCSLMLVL